MQGVNTPLALQGFEYVLAQAFEAEGVSEQGLQRYFSGLPFLPWQRMGNMAGPIAAPLTPGLRAARHQLQLQILELQLSLGMEPVLPCFSGNVPSEWASAHPSASTQPFPSWHGITQESAFLDPTDPAFARIGSAVAAIQSKLYGDATRLFNCDMWMNDRHDWQPRSDDPSYLRAAGLAIPRSIQAVTPDAVWVMQGGWLFAYDWWKADGGARREAFLSGLNASQVLVLDLDMERGDEPVAYKGGLPWVWCLLHAFGGRPGMHGHIDWVGTAPFQYLQQPDNKASAAPTQVGMGVTAEGMLTDPVVYGLFYDAWWSHGPIQVDQWIGGYLSSRYGTVFASKQEAKQAWGLLLGSVYGSQSPLTGYGGAMTRPPATAPDHSYPKGNQAAADASNAFLVLADAALNYTHEQEQEQGQTQASAGAPLVYDVVDAGRQALDMYLTDAVNLMLSEQAAGHASATEAMAQHVTSLLADAEQLLRGSPCRDHYLANWIQDARSWAQQGAGAGAEGEPSADALEQDARNQLVVWGPGYDIGPTADYAGKAWAGLVGGYYLRRFEALG